MSRAQLAKSRAEKGKPPVAQTPVITHEIVPGKFNENDWNGMLDKDGAEDYVLDIVDEILDFTMNQIYTKYVDRQLLPFTISQAKDAILQIIDWQFLACDSGEESLEADPTWQPEDEPEPAVTDCWAQGAVPKKSVKCNPTPDIPEEVVETVEEEQLEETKVEVKFEEEPEMADKVSETDDQEVIVKKTKSKQKARPRKKTDKSTGTAVKPTAVVKIASTTTSTASQANKKAYRRYAGPLKSAGVSRITESLDDREFQMHMEECMAAYTFEPKPGTSIMPTACNSILRVQAGRPPGTKDVVYDDLGHVIAVVRLDPEKLPNHMVNVKFRIVDPAVEAAQARLEAMRHGRYIGMPSQPVSKRPVKSQKDLVEISSTTKSVKNWKATNQPSIAPLPPPLIEAMEVTTGVVVKEGGRVKKGPTRYIRISDSLEDQTLRAIPSRIPTNLVDVSDLLDRTTPILRTIENSPPLPPITSPRKPMGVRI